MLQQLCHATTVRATRGCGSASCMKQGVREVQGAGCRVGGTTCHMPCITGKLGACSAVDGVGAGAEAGAGAGAGNGEVACFRVLSAVLVVFYATCYMCVCVCGLLCLHLCVCIRVRACVCVWVRAWLHAPFFMRATRFSLVRKIK